MRELKIAYGGSRAAKIWSNKLITFDALCERLQHTVRTPETAEEYPHLPREERDRIKDKGGFVGGWLKNGRRKAASVECRSMLTHDVDKPDAGFLDRYRAITTVKAGMTFDHVATARNGWNAIVINAQVGWVSGKYSKVI